ncbi:hypothetical protein ACT7CX_19865 [Bacillus cereus]
MKHVPRYKSSTEIIESGITKGMSISESTKLMNDLLTSNILKDDAELKEYDFADLIQSEILEDGVSISKVSNVSMLSRVLVGGALAGGVGAIVGGSYKQKYFESNGYKYRFENSNERYGLSYIYVKHTQ